jgi:iron(III) transport system ATP-binding protein
MSVKLVDISKTFLDPAHPDRRVTAVRGANLEVQDGEFVTLLGPSGCGKTTTLRIISGFETPSTGEVWISGIMVNDQPPNKRDTSMVFQSYAIFPHLSVGQNIGFGLQIKGLPKCHIREEVQKIMQVMNLENMADRRPDQLSGGQQQRVALARAIINRPSVLLFDEPLSNLDAKLREQMRLEIRRIQQTFGITSIYVTHDQIEAMTVSDRIVVMNKGNLIQIGTPFEIYSRPASRFVADFIGKVNIFEGRVSARRTEGVELEFPRGKRREIQSWHGDLATGDPAAALVRPEALKLHRVGLSGAPFDDPFLKGRIEKVVYLGPVVEYEIDCGVGRAVQAVTHNPVEEGLLKRGELVEVDFSTVAAHVIPNKDRPAEI